MKAKINYKSKKTIIIICATIALLGVATAGVVAYIKGNNVTSAESGNLTDQQNTIISTDGQTGSETEDNNSVNDVIANTDGNNSGNN